MKRKNLKPRAELSKLSPCPFCGGVAVLRRYEGAWWVVKCRDGSGGIAEGCDIQPCTTPMVKASAIEAWNTRRA